MCLAIPARLVEVAPPPPDDAAELRQGRADFGGVTRSVCLALLPDAAVGQWVIVHVGFAIARLDEAEARRVLAEIEALEAFSEEQEK